MTPPDDLKKKYPAFAREGDWCPLWLVMIFSPIFVPFRSFVLFLMPFLYVVYLLIFGKKNETDEEYKRAAKVSMALSRGWLWGCGIQYVEEHHPKVDYTQYLGEGYETPETPNTIISNHTSVLDNMYFTWKYYPMFLTKMIVKKFPLFGTIVTHQRGIFLNREGTSREYKIKMLETLKNRQEEREQGKHPFPIAVFPEGTQSNGHAMLKFRRGAFVGLKSIEAHCLEYTGPWFPATTEVMNVIDNMFLVLAIPWQRLRVSILPIFKPTDFMYKKFAHYGDNKPDIYARVM
jgi:1-acyl-sn-glycerol-3-phosphate acyltransferase